MNVDPFQFKFPRWLWLCLGFTSWFALGWFGNWAISSAWRNAQVAEFRTLVNAVAAFAPYRDWSDPWESDPQWTQLEKELKVDLVPLAVTAGAEEAAGRTEAAKVSDALGWVMSPGGQWRATVTVPLAVERDNVIGIRATRSFDNRVIVLVWWSLWSLLHLATACALLLSRPAKQADAAVAESEIEPWLALIEPATKRKPLAGQKQLQLSGPTFLPELGADTPLAQRLNDVARHINSQLETLSQLAARSELILSNLNEGVLAVDHLGRVILINAAVRKQLELGSEDVYQRPLVEVVRVPRVVELLEHVLQSQQASEQHLEIGATTRYLRLLASPLTLEGGRIGVLLMAIDVSSSQRSELSRREFITGASHELKTPLAAIRAYTETLQSIHQDDPVAAQRFLKNILSQADRMDRLVSGMLQLARAESGSLKLKLERIDAVTAIQPCLVAALGMAQAKDITVHSQLPQPPLLLLADRDAFQTIASNLLSNAVRYTRAGGRIDVVLAREAGQVLLQVSDTGIGIAEADQERIFERFYRVEKDRALNTGGTGLGLAIVKQLTQALDGSVQVTSHKGKGTCFEIRLPAVGFTQSSSILGGERLPVG